MRCSKRTIRQRVDSRLVRSKRDENSRQVVFDKSNVTNRTVKGVRSPFLRYLASIEVEVKQIPKALHFRGLLANGWTPSIDPKTGKPKRIGWINHLAILMWEGYELALCKYMNVMIDEWVGRGYKNTMLYIVFAGLDVAYPHWLGDENLHRSHRNNLLSKATEFYNQYDWNVPDNLFYARHTGLQHDSDLHSEKLAL